MRKHIHLICVASEHIFTEVINSFHKYFCDKGHKFTYEYAFKTTPVKKFSQDMNIVIKAQREFDPKILPSQSTKVLFQSEQFSHLRKFDSTPHSEPWDLVLEIFPNQFDVEMDANTPVIRYFPVGYEIFYNMQTKGVGFVEDRNCIFDCYFFGAKTKYRVNLWHDSVLPIAPNSRFANTDIGPDKYHNIIYSKVNIFIPAWEPYYFSNMRVMQILANRKYLLVVSDTPQDFIPYPNVKHFQVVRSIELRNFLKRLLKNPESRKQFVEEVMWPDLIANHKFSDHLDKALENFL